jgi:hypothetical protein
VARRARDDAARVAHDEHAGESPRA